MPRELARLTINPVKQYKCPLRTYIYIQDEVGVMIAIQVELRTTIDFFINELLADLGKEKISRESISELAPRVLTSRKIYFKDKCLNDLDGSMNLAEAGVWRGSILNLKYQFSEIFTADQIEKLNVAGEAILDNSHIEDDLGASPYRPTRFDISSITVKMKIRNGTIFKLEVDSKITTDDFREKIISVFLDRAIAINCKITCNDHDLNYGKTLEDLGIKEDSIIEIGMIEELPPESKLGEAQVRMEEIAEKL